MYTWDTRVLYSQLGPDGRLSLTGLLDLFQDIATLHAEDFGSGLDTMTANGRAWLLSRWRVRLGELPRSAARVQVCTQAYESRRALNRRKFALLDERGAELAAADSLWTLVDIATGAPTPASQVVERYLEPGEGPDLGELPRKVQLPENAVPAAAFPITDDLLDTNHHVNNVRSVALAMRFLPEDLSFSALAVDYQRPLLPGQQVQPLVARTDRGFVVALTVDGQSCVCAEFIR
ncbi:MAG: hypothetical protein IKU58_06405 [Clostridia bacterium]|nr:hypothetical protein [Clostridia bacterium]